MGRRYFQVVLVAAALTGMARADQRPGETARQHYEEAVAAFNLSEFRRAAEEYTEAYKLFHDPTLLYNIAQSYRLARDVPHAISFYQAYLRSAPNATNRAEVEERLARMKEQPAREGVNSPSEDPDTELARRHFEAGARYYQEGKYAEAIAEFEEIRKIKDTPNLDYNIARANDRLGNTDAALVAYRRYLTAASEARDAAEIRARIEVLEKRKSQPVNTPAVAPPPAQTTAAQVPSASQRAPAVPRARGRKKKIAGLALGLVGAAALVAGAAMEGLAKQASDGLTRENLDGQRLDKDQYALGRSEDAAGATLLTVGAVAAVTGLVLGIVGIREARTKHVALAPWVSGTNAGVLVEVRQ
jgi:tetratricopeptide (TPR) repeat protein